MGYRSDALDSTDLPLSSDPWTRVLVPGLASAHDGRGVRAFLAILIPAAVVVAPLVRRLGYRPPLAFDLHPALPTALALAGLGIIYLIRARTLLSR